MVNLKPTTKCNKIVLCDYKHMNIDKFQCFYSDPGIPDVRARRFGHSTVSGEALH